MSTSVPIINNYQPIFFAGKWDKLNIKQNENDGSMANGMVVWLTWQRL